jgi:hypothetical protein
LAIKVSSKPKYYAAYVFKLWFSYLDFVARVEGKEDVLVLDVQHDKVIEVVVGVQNERALLVCAHVNQNIFGEDFAQLGHQFAVLGQRHRLDVRVRRPERQPFLVDV